METSLDMLKNSSISEEDSRLVDSILNELNSNDKEPAHVGSNTINTLHLYLINNTKYKCN